MDQIGLNFFVDIPCTANGTKLEMEIKVRTINKHLSIIFKAFKKKNNNERRYDGIINEIRVL